MLLVVAAVSAWRREDGRLTHLHSGVDLGYTLHFTSDSK